MKKKTGLMRKLNRSLSIRIVPTIVLLLSTGDCRFLYSQENHIQSLEESQMPSGIKNKLTILSWNLMFLYDEINDQDQFPENRYKRSLKDFQRLGSYFRKLSPDIALFQEIENETAIYKVVDKTKYLCKGSDNPNSTQEVFICWKNELGKPEIQEWKELLINERLRPAISAEFKIRGKALQIINVHLKSGNHEYDYGKDFVIRKKQFTWLNKLLRRKSSFVIAGDFNQRFDKPDDRGWKVLQRSIDMIRLTSGLQSDCWQHRAYYIDHFIFSGELSLDNFRQYKYSEDDGKFDGKPESEKSLSDHCPISAVLTL